LTSDTAPPPSNPKLQQCLENYVFADYDRKQDLIVASIERIKTANIAYLPDEYQDKLTESYSKAGKSFAMIEGIRSSSANLDEYSIEYRPIHVETRLIQKSIRRHDKEIKELSEEIRRIGFNENEEDAESKVANMKSRVSTLEAERAALVSSIPEGFKLAREKFETFAKKADQTRRVYRQNVDESYEIIKTLRRMLTESDQLEALMPKILPLADIIREQSADEAMDIIKALEAEIDALTETHKIKSRLSKARRALRGNSPDPDKAITEIMKADELMRESVAWHKRAASELSGDLESYDSAIADTIGMRMQARLSNDQAESVASCLAVHKDLSLHF